MASSTEIHCVTDLPRRTAIRQLLQSIAVLVIAPASACTVLAGESCVDTASESLRTSLNYSGVSADPSKSCAGCGFYTRDEAKQGCGNCVIMSGQVDETGYCDSWATRGG
jgi:hypothetical protein